MSHRLVYGVAKEGVDELYQPIAHCHVHDMSFEFQQHGTSSNHGQTFMASSRILDQLAQLSISPPGRTPADLAPDLLLTMGEFGWCSLDPSTDSGVNLGIPGDELAMLESIPTALLVLGGRPRSRPVCGQRGTPRLSPAPDIPGPRQFGEARPLRRAFKSREIRPSKAPSPGTCQEDGRGRVRQQGDISRGVMASPPA
ncbi:hypothetical protein Bbelb_262300 [Branchiostoma belcheri]|nr:hypothetical protein Bbelb_262300 [Branchiostoma belcheri]